MRGVIVVLACFLGLASLQAAVPGYAPPNPAAYYSFNDSGTPGNDDSGNGNHGAFTNASYTASGKDAGGMDLSSSDNARMLITRAGGGNGVDIGNEWTVAGWFKDIDPGGWRTFCRGAGGDHQAIIENGNTRLGMYANGHGNFRPAAPQYDIPTDLPASADGWRHLAVVGTGGRSGQTDFYINGTWVGQSSEGSDTDIYAIGNFQNGGQRFSDYLDEVFIYTRALNASDVNDLFVMGPDVTAPTISSTSPDDDATGVYPAVDLTADFSEDITLKNGGTVTITDLDDGSSTVTITLPDGRVTSPNTSDLVVNLSSDLEFGTNYSVRISSDAVEDQAATPNAFAGIADDTSWNFSTAAQDLTAPAITGKSPADDASNALAFANIVATFDDNILANSGNIVIKDLTDGTDTRTIAVTDGTQVSIAGNVLTVDPTSNLTGGKNYAVRMDAGVVKNFSDVGSAAIADDTTWNFAVISALTWDSNAASAGQTDGGGTWLNANQWWNGTANQTWVDSEHAVIGNGGSGGTVTLGTVNANSVNFGSFNGTYRLNSGTLAQTGGISDSASSSTVQIDSLISGTGGIAKTGANLFIITNNSNAYTGATVVNGGILQFGTGWPNSWSAGSLPTTTNLEINDGTVAVWYYSNRNLGTGPGEIQLTGGTCGFAMRQGDAGGVGWTVNGSSAYEVVWGIPTFNPSVLLLSDAAAGANRTWRFVNKIDLNGADRTVSVTSTSHNGQMEGVIRNSSGTEAGIIKIGAGTMVLTNTNTYDGDTTVNGGTLQLNRVNSNNENSTVTIAAGAKLTLNHSGSDTVYTAFIGGTQRDAGEYGHTNSGATNGGLGVGALDAYFGAGSGKLITTADIVAPTLASSDFVDNKSGGPVAVGVVTTYTVTFSEDMDAATVTTADFGNAGTATVTIDSVTETSPGVFSVVVTPTGAGSLQLRVNALATLADVAGNALDTAVAITDDTNITVQATDTTPPTLASSDIVDDKTGGPVGVGTLVTYTVSFNEDMDAATVTGADFSNSGSAGVTIGAVTETGVNTGVFTVAVTTTGTGTLRLQVNQSASLLDVAGNALNTAAAILDDTTLTVENTPPTLASTDIVDDQAGGPVTIGTLVTYTVTFSEDMDDSTVSAADFGNNGTASISFGTVTETAAGVFSVQVTPTGDGTIELQVNAAADLRDLAGNALNTAAAIVDNTSITVTIPTFTWDANAAAAGQTDGGGTWLNANQWWDGASNQTWANGANAIIGNGGNGGTLTLGTISLGTLTLDNFNGTYTLNSGSLAQSGGISLGGTATNARINPPITGAGGIAKGNPGLLILTNNSNAYTGATIVNDGVLQLGTGWSNSQSIPGGISTAGATSGSNLEINGGTVTLCYFLRRTLGSGPGELQITGGHSGFNHWQADTYGRININNSSNFELVWGSAFFKPDALVLNEDAATPQQVVNIQNKIDLNGATRTVACNSTRVLGARVDANNGNMPTAGGRLTNVIRNSGGTPAGITKIGAGTLQLTAVNTFDGDTTVVAGTLWLKTINASNENSTVSIAAGATINLDFAGADTVAKLFVGGAQVGPGEFGHSSSGATNGILGLGALDAYFEASAGKLNVTQGPPPTVIRIR